MIKNIYGRHTFFFSVLAITFALVALILEKNLLFFNDTLVLFFCLLLIISIGISHGAMDNHKAEKLLRIYKVNNKIIFFVIYILISCFVIFIWSLYASITLLTFLVVASYHFGREDTSFLNFENSYVDQFFYLVKGSFVVFCPLFFHFDETLKIFETLFLDQKVLVFLKEKHWIINFCLGSSIFGYLYFVYKNKLKDFEILLLDMLVIIILNFILSPLVAFTIYFCFLHSVRHIVSISFELDPINFTNGLKSFIKKALPLTIVSACLYFLAIIFLVNFYGLNDVIVKVIFIGLASLTFPHILLEYLIEINEKRN